MCRSRGKVWQACWSRLDETDTFSDEQEDTRQDRLYLTIHQTEGWLQDHLVYLYTAELKDDNVCWDFWSLCGLHCSWSSALWHSCPLLTGQQCFKPISSMIAHLLRRLNCQLDAMLCYYSPSQTLEDSVHMVEYLSWFHYHHVPKLLTRTQCTETALEAVKHSLELVLALYTDATPCQTSLQSLISICLLTMTPKVPFPVLVLTSLSQQLSLGDHCHYHKQSLVLWSSFR